MYNNSILSYPIHHPNSSPHIFFLTPSLQDVPFSWGPGSSGDVSEPRCLELLRREARPEAAQWCWRHDVLNVLQEMGPPWNAMEIHGRCGEYESE